MASIVEGCREHIAPSMWWNHMNAHTKDIFAGSVPTCWLEENGLYIASPNVHWNLVQTTHQVVQGLVP